MQRQWRAFVQVFSEATCLNLLILVFTPQTAPHFHPASAINPSCQSEVGLQRPSKHTHHPIPWAWIWRVQANVTFPRLPLLHGQGLTQINESCQLILGTSLASPGHLLEPRSFCLVNVASKLYQAVDASTTVQVSSTSFRETRKSRELQSSRHREANTRLVSWPHDKHELVDQLFRVIFAPCMKPQRSIKSEGRR